MFEIKIEGLEKLRSQLKEAEMVAKIVRENIATLEFDPEDPASKRKAINEGKLIVDQKLGKYKGNPFVVSIIESLKEQIEHAVNQQKSDAD